MTFKNNRAPLLDRRTDRQTENTICRAAWSQLKTLGHLFWATSSFVHHFVAIGEFKLELTVRKCPIWVKIDNFFSCVTFKFDRWPSKTTGHLFYATSSFVHHFFVAISGFKLEIQSGNTHFGSKSMFFEPCDLEIWRMTLKNNRAPLLSNIKLCASFHYHMWTQTGFSPETV